MKNDRGDRIELETLKNKTDSLFETEVLKAIGFLKYVPVLNSS